MTTTDTLTVEYVDPDTVLCGSNIRADPQLTDAFLESVRTRGVLTPCPAVRTAYRAAKAGDLYLCGSCSSRLWKALAGQGWTFWPLGVHAIAPQALAS